MPPAPRPSRARRRDFREINELVAALLAAREELADNEVLDARRNVGDAGHEEAGDTQADLPVAYSVRVYEV